MKLCCMLLGLGSLAFARAARSDSLNLSLAQTFDVSGLNHVSTGDMAFDHSSTRLFLSDGATNGLIYEINSLTGALIGTIDPSSIPGLHGGPDALALHATPSTDDDFYVFSSFGESEGGRITHGGALVTDFGSSFSATGADTDSAGNLWISSGTTVGGGTVLHRLSATGVIQQSVTVQGSNLRMMDITFDPFSGALYGLREDGILVEVNTTTGAQVSATDLNPFLLSTNSVAGGVTFGSDGRKLFVGSGTAAAADTILVLRREFDSTICDGLVPGFACPCANAGLPGHGCENSFGTGGGLLSSSGLPRVSQDSFFMLAEGLPPSTSCLFFQGTTTPESGPPPFGDGLRCVQGTVIRLSTKATVGGAAVYPVGGDPLVSVRGQIPSAGATRFYQAWYRNVASFCTPAGFNLTNGIRVVWRP